MPSPLIRITDDFYNLRGSFKTAGVLDIGTQASLVRRDDGTFVMLDCYTLNDTVTDQVMRLTDGGKAITHILNLHPFHTIHIKAVHEQFPHAKLYGTARHLTHQPELPWQPLRTEDAELHAQFADFQFSIPRGVDFISDNEKLHFSSVLAVHTASRTLHVDDTLMFTKLPFVGGVRMHPTLKSVLEPRAGAVADFRAWGDELVELCAGVDNLCAAHTRPLLGRDNTGASIAVRVREALDRVSGLLDAHERTYT